MEDEVEDETGHQDLYEPVQVLSEDEMKVVEIVTQTDDHEMMRQDNITKLR